MVKKVIVRNDLKSAISDVINQLGGFKKFININDTVFLKPNFNTADPFPASTDLEFLRTVISLIYEYGVKKLIIGDSCTMMLKTETVMKELNIPALREQFPDLEIVNFDRKKWVRKKVPGGKYLKTIYLPEVLERIDKLILLPCLKTHQIARFTGSLKLAVGFMRPCDRISLHARNLQEKIAEINLMFQPDLIIMDARKIFVNRGPSHGQLETPKMILAGTNRIEIDIEGIKIIQGFEGNSLAGIEPEELPQIRHAREIGIDLAKKQE